MKFKSYNFREKQKKMQDMSCPPMLHSNPLIATLEAENLQICNMTSYTSSYIPEILLCGCEQTLGASVSIFYKKKKKRKKERNSTQEGGDAVYHILIC